jgi:hypothetical protein
VRRIGSLFALILLLALLLSTAVAIVPAVAHEELSLHALPVITAVEPEVGGIDFRVLQLTAPAIVVENSTNHRLLVDDHAGHPFLRIGPEGVEANANSYFTYLSFDPDGQASMPAALGARGKPRWVTLSEGSSWTWFDPRIRFDPQQLHWSVPMEFRGAAVTVSGTYEPLQGHGHFVTRISDVPRAPGLDLRIVEGPVPGIYARNASTEILAVPGRSGEPFLRIGPHGVLANVASPSWYLGGSQAISRVPRFAHAGARPRWRRVSRQPVWGWLEYRAALPADMQIRGVLGTQASDVLTWSTPLSLGEDSLSLTGIVRWVPAQVSRQAPPVVPSPRWPLILGVGGLSVVAANSLRTKRRPV